MSHTAPTVDTLLIRPTHGDQTGAGDNERTDHWEGIRKEPVRKRVTPDATNTKPADQNNQIGGSQPHSPQTTPENRPARVIGNVRLMLRSDPGRGASSGIG
jgi:hypothetical protein